MGGFLSFRTMWPPVIIQAAFVVGAGLVALGGIITAIGGLASGEVATLLGGLAVAVFGPFFIRIWCEVLVVVFKIHKAVERIADQGQRP
jgi:hypothetical protein